MHLVYLCNYAAMVCNCRNDYSVDHDFKMLNLKHRYHIFSGILT